MTNRIYTSDYKHGGTMKTATNDRKGEILAFLKKFPLVAVAAGHFNDAVTGEEVDASWCAYRDGGFTWDTCDVYHFEKYDLELSPEFCAHALAV